MLSACVSMCTESHKICKVWALVYQVLPRCFLSYRLCLNKSIHRVKQVGISESTDINRSILINRFYPIEALIFIREFFCFPIIHHNSIFSTHVRRICCSNNCQVRAKSVKRLNVQQVFLYENGIFLARIKVWSKFLRKYFSLIHQ